MSEILQCRYNKNHKVKKGRLLIHEEKCPDKKTSNLVSCPYNPMHKVSFFNINKHKTQCPDRPQIDEVLHNQILAFIDVTNKKKEAEKENPEVKWQKELINQKNMIFTAKEVKTNNNNNYFSQNNENDDKKGLFIIQNENGIIEYDEEEYNFEIQTVQDDCEDNRI